jgi:hypothetical protein
VRLARRRVRERVAFQVRRQAIGWILRYRKLRAAKRGRDRGARYRARSVSALFQCGWVCAGGWSDSGLVRATAILPRRRLFETATPRWPGPRYETGEHARSRCGDMPRWLIPSTWWPEQVLVSRRRPTRRASSGGRWLYTRAAAHIRWGTRRGRDSPRRTRARPTAHP